MHQPNSSNGHISRTSGGPQTDEEELDKLLLGLDQLTETLPDLCANNPPEYVDTFISILL